MADLRVNDLQSLVSNYEVAIKNITGELTEVQKEQDSIKNLLSENSDLRSELTILLGKSSSTCQTEHQYYENDLIENLKAQLQALAEEKNNAIKLWQNSLKNIDYLEGELKIYQNNTEGLVPKSKVTKLKQSYEEKLNKLEENLGKTKAKLEETINITSKKILIRDEEIAGSVQSHDKTFEIVKNLEEEVLNLQKRLDETRKVTKQHEREIQGKTLQIDKLTIKNRECVVKVEDALQVVEQALQEKDAAILREAKAKEEVRKLSQTILELMNASDEKLKSEVKETRAFYEGKLEQLLKDLNALQEEAKSRQLDLENANKRCAILEKEIERQHTASRDFDESSTSKLAVLEKNFESTFQKLLISEKHNIQLKAEKESIKMDLDQMAQFYERDIKARDTERNVLKLEIRDLKIQLNEAHLRLEESASSLVALKENIAASEEQFKEEIKQAKEAIQQITREKDEKEQLAYKHTEELKNQLTLQVENNQKWRQETKAITEKLENRIRELKAELTKKTNENRNMTEKLADAAEKVTEYKNFLEMMATDVTKITNIASCNESFR